MKSQTLGFFELPKNVKFRYALLSAILLISLITPLINVGKAYAGSDDYPDKWKGLAMDSVFDSWGEYNRECTSFVAWRLSSQNGYTMPFHDSAINWAADAKARSIMVDSSPAKGAVAYKGNHVAWVESVSSDRSKVTVEEYNEVDSNGNGIYADDGTYSERTLSASTFQYIHFKDITNVQQASSSTSIYSGKLIRNQSGTISYVSNNGLSYWVPTMVSCLGGAGAIVQLSDSQFSSIPRSLIPANCLTKYNGLVIRDSGGTISYVDTNGIKHWVPTMGTVSCLSGARAVTQLDSATFGAIASSPSSATCSSSYINRMVVNSAGTVSYVDTNNTQHWIPDGNTVNCLGGWNSIAQTDDTTFNSIPAMQAATCGATYLGRMIHAPDGTVAYTSSDGYSHWVPNGDTVNCLGGWGAIMNVDWASYSQFPASNMATCATR